MGVQFTNRFFRGNIDGIYNNIKGVAGSFIWSVTIINGNGREIRIWNTTIIWKCIIEAFINPPSVVLSCCNLIVLAFL